MKNLHTKFHGEFYNRSKRSKYLLVVLAGYKEYLYPFVFDRLVKFIPNYIDVCIVSSGKFSDELKEKCEKENWSYLSTKKNNVGLVQNVAINLHPAAEYIFKLDEDIFITESYFEDMIKAFSRAEKSEYTPSAIAPMLLVNGFCTPAIIDILNIRKEYMDRFGKILITTGEDCQIENNQAVARFMWGEGGVVPHIDTLNKIFKNLPVKETPCPIRFSIGAILYKRELWEKMGYFDVKHGTNGMLGTDEEKLCKYCIVNSKPIMVSENIIVGHFSFGKQTKGMREFFCENPDRFSVLENN